jgi:hypothetical protein
MRLRVFCSVSLLSLCGYAVTVDIPRLQAPAFADKEVAGDTALPGNRLDKLRTFRLEMTFASTPTNNVQVAFGRDNRPADGKLAMEETDYIVGWDCGEWFLRPQGLRERFTYSPSVTSGTRTLTAFIRVTAAGVFQSPVFADNGTAFTFAGLQLTPFPAWLKSDLWTHLRVTVRGSDIPDEAVKVKFAPDGATIIIK